MAEKTEEVTPKKLRDARQKGQVAKSQDLPSAFTFIASLAVFLALAPSIFNQIRNFILTTLELVSSVFSAISAII